MMIHYLLSFLFNHQMQYNWLYMYDVSIILQIHYFHSICVFSIKKQKQLTTLVLVRLLKKSNFMGSCEFAQKV